MLLLSAVSVEEEIDINLEAGCEIVAEDVIICFLQILPYFDRAAINPRFGNILFTSSQFVLPCSSVNFLTESHNTFVSSFFPLL
jgi:hypothetical protein